LTSEEGVSLRCHETFSQKKWAHTEPIFFGCLGRFMLEKHWRVIEATARDLGLELVDLEQTAGGLLRVYIDLPGAAGIGPEAAGVSVEDCERLSNQLVHELPVEGIHFERLEVSSPGLDRRLSQPAHFLRFAGHEIKLKLRQPVEGRKNFQGRYQLSGASESDPTCQLVFSGADGAPLALTFLVSDVDQARLVPEISFKERRR
jgi:ribosome maturation factor RimP